MANLLIPPRAKDLGDGFFVYRVLPYAKKRMIGPFIFWDHMGPVELKTGHEMKVRAHPHIGLATLTYLFSGEIMHRDSLGYEQPIQPGAVNWMTAGKGIVHSERSRPNPEFIGKPIDGIQSWMALPQDQQEIEPSFQHIPKDQLPQVDWDSALITVIAGTAFGKTSPVQVYSKVIYLDGKFEKGGEFSLPSKGLELAAYVVKGSISIAGQTLKPKEMFAIWDESQFEFEALEDGTQVMVLGGEPFPEERHIWWNFVSTSKERIEQAKKDWLEDRFGQVINEDERIPLPEN